MSRAALNRIGGAASATPPVTRPYKLNKVIQAERRSMIRNIKRALHQEPLLLRAIVQLGYCDRTSEATRCLSALPMTALLHIERSVDSATRSLCSARRRLEFVA
jgi:hypothetical protein